MLHGIDISNWQRGLKIPETLDFAIMKATGGTGFVDPCCDNWVQECKSKGILWGFYHFAGDGWTPKPEEEAAWFYENTKNYVGEGIPVLDIEDTRISDWGTYSQRFVDKYHAITGVYPMIYASASTLSKFNGYPLVETCGLWIAGYPDSRMREIGDVPKFNYDVSPWKFAAIWQYSSNGKITNCDGAVDLNVAYMDREAWKLYATSGNNDSTEVDITTQWPSVNADEATNAEKKWHFENSKVSVDVKLK